MDDIIYHIYSLLVSADELKGHELVVFLGSEDFCTLKSHPKVHQVLNMDEGVMYFYRHRVIYLPDLTTIKIGYLSK